MSNRPRVLLSVYTASPYQGSEPGIGWGRVYETAKFFDTWVICCEEKKDIKQWFSENGKIDNLHFSFFPLSRHELFLEKTPGLLFLSYHLWQRRAFRLAVKLHQKYDFDLVHQVNYGTFREPGYLWKLDCPFVWGPVGGMENYPWRFLAKAGFKGFVTESIRGILNILQLRAHIRVRKAAKKAAAVLTVNSLGEQLFKKVFNVTTVHMLDLGTNTIHSEQNIRRQEGSLRILWCASLLHRKALHLLIEAISQLPDSFPVTVRIMGKGPLEGRWQQLSRELGVEQYIRFLPWLDLNEVKNQYEWADMFVFSSLRDASGSTVLEALSYGLPVVCFDHQGVADIVTQQCGIKIPVTIPREAIASLRKTIIELSQNRQKLMELSVGAIQRAREFLWLHKGEQTAELYFDILNNSRGKYFSERFS